MVNLTQAGLYKTVRKVFAIDGWYYLGTEHLKCKFSKKKYASWSNMVLKQLSLGYKNQFPAVLTYR